MLTCEWQATYRRSNILCSHFPCVTAPARCHPRRAATCQPLTFAAEHPNALSLDRSGVPCHSRNPAVIPTDTFRRPRGSISTGGMLGQQMVLGADPGDVAVATEIEHFSSGPHACERSMARMVQDVMLRCIAAASSFATALSFTVSYCISSA